MDLMVELALLANTIIGSAYIGKNLRKRDQKQSWWHTPREARVMKFSRERKMSHRT